MKNFILSLSLIYMLGACNNNAKVVVKWPDCKPPVCPEKKYVRILHNDTVIDNYFWLNDYFKKGPDSTAVVNYLTEENNYTDCIMAGTKDFQQNLYKEMRARIVEKDVSVPYYKNGYYYYSRQEDGEEYFKLCRKKGSLDATEEILLDIDAMAKGNAYYQLGGYDISSDNNILVFSIDEVSRRQYNVYFKNLSTGEILKDKITGTGGDPVFANDNKTIFYTSNNPKTLLSEKINKHIIGEPKDITVYEEHDKSNYISVDKSKNNAYIIITSQATLSSEVHYLDANNPHGKFKVFQPRVKDVIYFIAPTDNKFLIYTNKDAKNFKIMECSLDNTSDKNWKELVAHNPEIYIDGLEEFKDFMILSERKDGLTKFHVYNNKDKTDYYIEFDEPAYTIFNSNNVDFNAQVFNFGYTSFITPLTYYEYNIENKSKKVLKERQVLGGYDPKNYQSERIMVKSRDGVSVPLSIVYKKGFKKDGTQPLLLYAYGSYGSSSDASFSSARISLLDRGFAFAIAHIRGGSELGRQWYEDGKLLKKMNTFYDFIDAGKYLVAEKFTSEKHLYAEGGSAGGLLMGAITNLEPQLWNGVIADVPFVDVINTMLDESIPLTTNEFDEWGNPKNKDYYDYMKKYNPYENIEPKEYPNLLVITGLHDSQVQYFEPAKYVAKLRKIKKDNGNLLLLKTEMAFGHGGASGRFDYLKEVALKYAFLFGLEGITK